jgi:hypothetical protein
LTAPGCLGLDAYGYLGAHHPIAPQPEWWDAFGVLWHKLLYDVVACGAYTSAQADAFRDLLDQHREQFDRPVVSRLLQMDVWGQNILVDARGNVMGLVDFDRALWGDVEIEFAVLDYCGFSEPAFWEGYGQPLPGAQVYSPASTTLVLVGNRILDAYYPDHPGTFCGQYLYASGRPIDGSGGACVEYGQSRAYASGGIRCKIPCAISCSNCATTFVPWVSL